MRKFLFILLFLNVFTGCLFCQVKTNAEKFYGLIEKSVSAVLNGKVKNDSRVFVDFSLPERFQLLKSSLLEKTSSFVMVNPQKDNSDFILTYSIEDAKVRYGDTFTKSFLGRNYVEREVALKGFANLNKPSENISTNRFEYAERDTVEYAGLRELGSPAYPFTNPEIPAEPFFSSIWEPIIAIGVAVTTVYLLFTVRSK